jgi:hypothetical protein
METDKESEAQHLTRSFAVTEQALSFIAQPNVPEKNIGDNLQASNCPSYAMYE